MREAKRWRITPLANPPYELRNAGALTHLDDKPAATKGKSKSKA
jgi:hypothetical protein